ncbi:MAG: hypothetical protein PHG02_00985 [Oscillospiraceae bacterium]|nr:hypothetical protein [Oscillospiraceae bacterium]
MANINNTKEMEPKNGRRRRRQIIGAILTLLVVIGVISVIVSGVHAVQWLLDDTEEKLEFEDRVATVVMLDPLPFESLEAANQDFLLQVSIWMTLTNENVDLYERDDVGALLLPVIDIDRNAAKLFGPNYKLTHQTFEDQGMTFMYDEESKRYTIPITGQVGNYTPQVVSIKNESNTKRVTVGYVSPYGASGEFVTTRTSNKPAKYMDYIFTKINKEYYLCAIQDSETKPEIHTGSSSQPPVVEQDVNQIVEEAADNREAQAQAEVDAAQSQAALEQPTEETPAEETPAA